MAIKFDKPAMSIFIFIYYIYIIHGKNDFAEVSKNLFVFLFV